MSHRVIEAMERGLNLAQNENTEANHYSLEFCSAFAYPFWIREQLAQILDGIVDADLCVESILLVGSTARGELCYVEEEKPYLFSDYELLIITQGKVDRRRKTLLELRINRLGDHLNPQNPLFHVDVGWYVLPQLPGLVHTVAIFEQKETGKVVFGKDYRALMPSITAESLNKKRLNEILYKRLWALLLYLPQGFFTNCLTPSTNRIAAYVLARNGLDLTTVLLPYEGVLLPTYAQRVRYLKENYANLEMAPFFGTDLLHFLTMCLEIRNSLIWEEPLLQIYTRLIHYLERSLDYLLFRQGYDSKCAIQTQSHLIFDENLPALAKIKRALRMFRGRLSLRRAFRWPRLPHKGLLTAGLLQMHRSMIAHLGGNPAEAQVALEQARSLLDSIISRPLSQPDSSEPFIEHWLSLRQDFGYLCWEFIRRQSPVFDERIQALTNVYD
jgi:hypothetical protein